MKARLFKTSGDGSIETRESWPFLRAACAVLAPAIVAAVVFAQWVDGVWRLGPLTGAVAGALGLLALAGVVQDRAFYFDARERRLAWWQGGWLRRRSGSVAFGNIRSIAVARSVSRDGETVRPHETFSAFLTTADITLRLPGSENPDRSEIDALVAAVRSLLGTAAGEPGDDAGLREWLCAGRVVDAIAHLRVTRGLSLSEATALVQRLKHEGP
jgi:hypothetical protein